MAFEIRRPWPQRQLHSMTDARWSIGRSAFWTLAGRCYYFPSMITVWHREPGGRDSGEVCRHHSRYRDAKGDWQWKFHHAWRFHIHHWKIQVSPLQELRRRLLTRCTWCGGPSRKGDSVNVSHQWGGRRARWWQGERGLYHWDCSSIAGAHHACVCEHPITEFDGWGPCIRCGKYRGHGHTEENLTRMRMLAAIPAGERRLREES
ncbi:hypothetical protein ACIBEJ_34435 [Nonomuraea sp. NPDC050790]|uniref:hypothetical protein n=1 Tax=Nonomuraea sp. NPDC050790 TaxID=3364371 RepID=UPI0037B82EF6